MLVVGLTGGISSGKSTISSWFLQKGIVVLDADQIVKNLQRPNSPLVLKLAEEFGASIVNENGELVRDVLGKIIFYDQEAKERLNAMIHPLVQAKLEEEIERLKKVGEGLVVLDIPLLFESRFEALVDRTVVVYVSPDVQLQRLMKRDQIDREYALAKMNSQMSLDEKRARADYVLINNGTMGQLREQFDHLFEVLWERACQVF
ncbi:MAG: dephospho-CoA kinase [Turicibacter sp.]|uniref:dephospho-CoA kinase n=1 Tax=unclassified Turicibacter TaxID=2638206 RepID=UPI0021749558|nr:MULTISPECIES: dephospho-CoA kinase [unclassified Turicibacter]MCI8700932.1 dephospho-CoA kinase [Turicibacter sp.]MCI9350487.1 dephospho-CoA kinase [Turicibacter sp.]MCU7204893.1 dephospho-CoA kinase [Turicibacter sp. TA25]MCU7208414.1 dephospho-CoA kinase [Turicibacter sp. 1E2]